MRCVSVLLCWLVSDWWHVCRWYRQRAQSTPMILGIPMAFGATTQKKNHPPRIPLIKRIHATNGLGSWKSRRTSLNRPHCTHTTTATETEQTYYNNMFAETRSIWVIMCLLLPSLGRWFAFMQWIHADQLDSGSASALPKMRLIGLAKKKERSVAEDYFCLS